MNRQNTWAVIGLLFLACATPLVGVAQVSSDQLEAETAKALSRFGSGPDSSRVAKILESGSVEPVVEARLWVRAGQPLLASKALESLPTDKAESPSAYLEGARIGLRYGDAAEAQRAAGYFWRACEEMDSEVRRELWLDLLPLMTPDEREAWDATVAGPEACHLVRDMFDERARLMATSVDERLVRHYERLHEAERQYWIRRARFYEDISDVFGRPEELWIDDRGLLLVRLGPPDHEEACPAALDLLAVCWAYYRPVGYKLFFLSIRRRVDGGVADGDYKIQESLGPRATLGDSYFHTYVVNGDLPESVIHHITRSAAPTVYVSRTDSIRGGLMDRAEGNIYQRIAQVAVHRYTSEAIESIPDVPAIASSAVMRWESLRFFNPSQEKWQVWVLASVRADDLECEAAAESTVCGITAKLAARTSSGYGLDSLQQRVLLPAGAAGAGAGIPVRMSLTAEPGLVPFTLAIEDRQQQAHGAWVQDTVRVPSPSGLAHVSDIAVAQREGGSWTRDGETYLQVTPSHITDPEGQIHVYFEVYGIGAGRDYEVELRLGRSDEAAELFAQSPSELPFRLAFNASMQPSGIGRHHVRLELGDTEPASYTLGIRIRNPVTGYLSLPSLTPIHVATRE